MAQRISAAARWKHWRFQIFSPSLRANQMSQRPAT
jgi:hypothetical protein